MSSAQAIEQGEPRGRTRPPRILNVVRDPRPEEIGLRVDWSPWYLSEEEDTGKSPEQERIIALLKSVLHELAEKREWRDVYIAGDQFFAWIPEEPNVRISPDVYLLDGVPKPPFPQMWETWRGYPPPRFAVEVVFSKQGRPPRWRKDYEDGPPKYAHLGTSELVIFDPDPAAGRAMKGRVALQVYRREADGAFVRAHHGADPAWSQELSAWLVVVREGPVVWLRVARDEAGHDLVPTTREAKEAERAAKEAERAAKEAAEREVERLRFELERLRGS